jgi:hypothetical protein
MHVGITKQLLQDVQDRIYYTLKPKNYRLEFGVENVSDTYKLSKDHPIVTQILWGEHLHLREVMPAKWCGKLYKHYSDGYILNVRAVVPTSDSSQETLRLQVKLTGAGDVVVPPNCSGTTETWDVPYDICPEIQGFFDKQLAEQKFNAHWHKISSDVAKFINSNKSLNAALKTWPELKAFIPDEYLERIIKKVDRSKAQERSATALAEIDREAAVSAATIAALAA